MLKEKDLWDKLREEKQQAMEKGLEQGLSMGLKYGLEYGKQFGQQMLLWRVLTVRFGGLPFEVLEQLGDLSSSKLERLVRPALNAPDQDAFLAALKKIQSEPERSYSSWVDERPQAK